MSRFWVSWYSTYHVDKGCTRPPFQVWITGQEGTLRRGEAIDYLTIVAMLDAASEDAIWGAVRRHFPDYEPRFCMLREPDAVPGNRFPGFENRTTLDAT